MLVVMLIQSGLTPQGRGVGKFYTLGGSCNLIHVCVTLFPGLVKRRHREEGLVMCGDARAHKNGRLEEERVTP